MPLKCSLTLSPHPLSKGKYFYVSMIVCAFERKIKDCSFSIIIKSSQIIIVFNGKYETYKKL